PGRTGSTGRYDLGVARPALSRTRPCLPADGLAHETRAGRRVAPGHDADRRGGRQGGLDRLCRSVGARAEDLDRGQVCRAEGRSDRAAADDPVAARCPEGKRAGGQRQEDIKPGQGEAVAEARSEDGVMLPQVMPMLAVVAKPFDSPDYSFEIKYDGV